MTTKAQNRTSLVLSSPPVSPKLRDFGSCMSPKPWKRVLGSRGSLNTDVVSCVTYFCVPKDTIKAKNYSVLIRRSKSLPCDLQKEGLSNADCRRKLMEFLRRQKTISSAYEFRRIDCDSKEDIYSSGSGMFECDTYALGMSRDFTECEFEESQNSQEQFRAPTPLEIVRMNAEMATFGNDLTEDNIAQAFNLTSTQSCEDLDRSQKNSYKIQKWLQRCVYEEPDDVTNL